MTGGGFPLFRRLPAEIRLLVWGQALDAAYADYLPRPWEWAMGRCFFARRLADVSLPVCRESRREAWRRYAAHHLALVRSLQPLGSVVVEVDEDDDDVNNDGSDLDRPRFDALTWWLGGDAVFARWKMAFG